MKSTIIFASLIGLACGIVARKFQPPGPAPIVAPPAKVSRSPRASAGKNPDSLLSLSWELRGNLTSEELLVLPHGGRLLAEMALWSFKATPAELAAHWDRVIESGETDMNTLDTLMTLWVRRDPHGALAHCRGGGQEYRCYWSLGRANPKLALELVDPKNSRFLSMVLRAICQKDPEYGLTLMEKYPDHDSSSVTQGVADGLANSDPAAAVAYAAHQEYFETERLRWWLAEDPRAAFDWSLDHPSLTAQTLGELMPLLMERDPGYFASRIASLPTGRMKLDLLKAQAKYLAAQDPQLAFALADSQEGPPRRGLMEAMGDSLVNGHPELARDLLTKLLEEEKQNLARGRTLSLDWVGSLIAQDPLAVLEVSRRTDSVPENGTIGMAERQVFGQWTALDAEASESWMLSQEAGPRQDRFIELYLEGRKNSGDTDFEHLIQLPGQILDEDQASRSLKSLMSSWKHHAPDDLNAYLESSRATPAQREYFETQLSEQ